MIRMPARHMPILSVILKNDDYGSINAKNKGNRMTFTKKPLFVVVCMTELLQVEVGNVFFVKKIK